jgi:Response regulators consisting of a CheY-like receiver domain and a winged-helix DNA-binding domain
MTKLLLVEDEKEFSAAVKDWLAAQGYVIDCAYTGPEALSCLKTGCYDLIILDLNLPGLSGIDCL